MTEIDLCSDRDILDEVFRRRLEDEVMAEVSDNYFLDDHISQATDQELEDEMRSRGLIVHKEIFNWIDTYIRLGQIEDAILLIIKIHPELDKHKTKLLNHVNAGVA